MNDSMHRHPIKPALVAALLCTLAATPGGADVLMRDAAGEDGTSAVGRWEAFAVSSAKSRIDHQDGVLNVTLAQGDRASFSRTANFTPEPAALLCRFNLTVTDGTSVGRQVLRCGWDFGTSVTDESDASTYARLGVVSNGEGFQFRSTTTQAAGTWFKGTQAVSWALNNSGVAMSYDAPDGSVEFLANDHMDVWVGRVKVLDEAAATQPAGHMTNLKWSWSDGAGSVRFDHFDVRPLEAAGAADADANLDIAPAAAESNPVAEADGSIPLDRATPNPFIQSTRFAFAISRPATRVDIGVFDLSGRRVRNLAQGIQAPGRYEVRWDGFADTGARAAHGVYFLRARIGADAKVSRLVYLAQ